MAGRQRDSVPPLGREGGYEFEVVELGPPTYFASPPSVKARGSLIPMGDGEGLTSRPAPPAERGPTRRAKRQSRTEKDDTSGTAKSAIIRTLLNFAQDGGTDGPTRVRLMELLVRVEFVGMMRELHELKPEAYTPAQLDHLIRVLLSPETGTHQDFQNHLETVGHRWGELGQRDLLSAVNQLKELLRSAESHKQEPR